MSTNDASDKKQLTLEPIENTVLYGLQKRFQQVFECPVIYATANDKVKALNRFLEGKVVSYPYAFLIPGPIGPNVDTYNPHVLGRHGLINIVKDGFAYKVRILPVTMSYDVEFVTNKYSEGSRSGSVLHFIRRWLFSRRFGYLKYTITYGKLALGIGATLTDEPVCALRENVTENESSYTVTANITVKGYMSEAEVTEIGIIQDLLVDGILANADGTIPENAQFFSFERITEVTK